MWIAEITYFKNSCRIQGGHLASSENKVYYIRIPKAASTTLCKTILHAKFPVLQAQQLSARQINFLADLHLEKKMRQQKTFEIFTVVRNPFARIVSVYREFFEKRNEPFIYEDYLFGIFRRDFSFQKFVETVERIPDHLKDQHLKPQHFFIRYYQRNNIAVKMMKLEEPETIHAFLRDRGLAFEVFNQSSRPYDYPRYYDPETLKAVASIYQTDILRFGYQGIIKELQFMVEHRHVQIWTKRE